MQMLNLKAYQIFVNEVEKHLESANRIFDGKTVPSPEMVYRAGASFHTIKGGAGFFGLNDIASTAAKLENLLHDASLDLEKQLNTVKGLIDQLEDLALQMPKPPKDE